MEDLRRNLLDDKIKRTQQWNNFKIGLKNKWVYIVLFIIFICIFIFPSFIGNIFGIWFNKIATAFLNNLTF